MPPFFEIRFCIQTGASQANIVGPTCLTHHICIGLHRGFSGSCTRPAQASATGRLAVSSTLRSAAVRRLQLCPAWSSAITHNGCLIMLRGGVARHARHHLTTKPRITPSRTKTAGAPATCPARTSRRRLLPCQLPHTHGALARTEFRVRACGERVVDGDV